MAGEGSEVTRGFFFGCARFSRLEITQTNMPHVRGHISLFKFSTCNGIAPSTSLISIRLSGLVFYGNNT
jgi:hypothetical protein